MLYAYFQMKQLRDNHRCYVCGRDNPAGLRVDFEVDHEMKTIRGSFKTRTEHQGYEGIVHGGILSALLDEAMAKLAFSLGMPAVTAEITVKFKAPVTPGEELAVTGKITNAAHRLVLAEAKIKTGSTIVAEATGKMLKA
jgi:uncharacterized protein (TIGR00369 family)